MSTRSTGKPLAPEVREVIHALMLAGHSYRQVADRLNADGVLRQNGKPWSPTTVFQATNPEVRKTIRKMRPKEVEQDAPSPEQIREACQAIQQGWSDRYRRSRERASRSYAIPEVSTDAIDAADARNG